MPKDNENVATLIAKIKAQKERFENFVLLQEGITERYVGDGLDLEDRQQVSVLRIADTNKDDKSYSKGYFHACTAFGKTYLMMALAEGYRAKVQNKKIVVFEESSSVLEQVKQDFIEKTSFSEDDIGAFYGKEKTIDTPIIICTYASMEKLISAIGKENIGLALCDEAHHILSENRKRVAEELDSACLYGFTATPEYNEAKSCAAVFENEIDSVSLRVGINEGLLCGFKNGLIVSRIPVDLTEIVDTNGDYNSEKLNDILKQSHIKGMREELADFYLTATDDTLGQIFGKTTIINVPSKDEAERVAEVFNQRAGQQIAKAYHTDSKQEVLDEFNQGNFPVLVQVNRITEGYSNPEVEICINYPTASKVRAAQRGGRGLRRNKNNPNKVALIMDIAFKKDDNKDTISSIKENRQVLFCDIAEDFICMPNCYEIDNSKQAKPITQDVKKTKITEQYKLFDIITEYSTLYELALDSAIQNEAITPEREKLDTDFDKTDFTVRTSLIKDDKAIDQKAKKALWEEISQESPELFSLVKSGSKISYVISKENMPKFREYLQSKGYSLLEREKLDTDFNKEDFTMRTSLIKDDKAIGYKAKKALWEEISQESPEWSYDIIRYKQRKYAKVPRISTK